MPNKNNIPSIRFKGFNQEWEETAISSKASFSKGKGYSKADIEQTGEPLLLYGSLYTDYKTNINDVTTFAKKKEGSVVSTGKEVVVPASGETAEDIARASAILKDGIILGGDLNVITTDDSVDKSYFALELTYGKSHDKLVKKAQGISVVHLHNSDIQQLNILLPKFAEQQKIGTFFATLDELIAAKEQELEKLRQLKAALLQQMFPSDENDNTNRVGYNDLIINQLDKLKMTISTTPNTPRIRFKGFTEPWERKKLDDVMDCSLKHYSHSRDKLTMEKGQVATIHYGDILVKFGNIVSVDSDSLPYIINFNSKDYYSAILKNGDIIIADTAEDETTGKAIEIQGINSEYVVAGLHTIVARPKEEYAPYFWGYFFNSNLYHNQLLPLMQGTKVLSINKTALGSTMLYFPIQRTEQQLIGDFFREQDSHINAANEQINKLKTIKQALLQKMFAA